MALWWKKTKEPYWPKEKILVAYHLFRTPEIGRYHQEDFYYPIRYPRSLQTLEAFPDLHDLSVKAKLQGKHYHIDRDHKKLKAQVLDYLKAFRSGKLDYPERVCFSYNSAKKILMNFFTSLAHFQGREVSFILYHLKEREDEFHRYFKNHHTQEFLRWHEADYHFPFYETLFSLHQLKEIDLGGIDLKYCKIHIKLMQKDKGFVSRMMSKIMDEKIVQVDILPIEDKEFLAYVNQNYINPITFNLRAKSSQVIFKLASEGTLKLRGYKQAFHYIQRNKRFRLFSRSNTPHHKLLDQEDGYILPAKGVRFRLITKEYLQN